MASGGERNIWADVGVVLLPAFVVVLFNLLHLRFSTPTAGGISFLIAALIAFYLFPRRRIRLSRLVIALIIAVGVAAFMSMLI